MSRLDEASRRALAGGPEHHRKKAREQGKLGVRERVGLFDLSSFSKYEVQGAQALAELNQTASATIFNVQLSIRRAKKLNLAA